MTFEERSALSDDGGMAEARALIEADDATRDALWRGLSEEQKSRLPPEVRAVCIESVERCSPWVKQSIERLRHDQVRAERGAARHESIADWPAPLDLQALAEREPEPPQFIADDWLPVGYASLLAGHGGSGKSAIALTLAVCIAADVPFFGVQVRRRRVMYLSCEDREDVLHWRLTRICAYLRIDLVSLVGWLDIVELVGRDSILWERDPRTGYTVTPAYGRLAERMRERDTEVLTVDSVTDTFGGTENARAEVKRFINSLLALVPADRGALLLVHHVDKATAKVATTGEGYSGSTAWHNSVRARWYLYPETADTEDGDRPQRTGRLLLELQKSNLGRTDQQMTFRWDDEAHLFVGEPVTAFDRQHQEREEERGILRALKACADMGVTVPASMQGPRTAYLVLSQRPDFPASLRGRERAKTARFRAHIESLRQLRHVEERSIRRTNRHLAETFALTPEGLRQCA